MNSCPACQRATLSLITGVLQQHLNSNNKMNKNEHSLERVQNSKEKHQPIIEFISFYLFDESKRQRYP